MIVDVVFDTVCPWCFIGKRRLEAALALRPNVVADIRWRPFLLNPHMPEDGIEQTAYLIRKFGSENRVRRIYGALAEAGRSVDIDFAFERIGRAPNSLKAHRLIHYADHQGLATACVEALFQAYFTDGQDTGDVAVLTAIGGRLGFSKADVRRFLEGDAAASWVEEENTRAHRLGINGVPAFVVDGQHAIAGAQEPPVLARLLDAAQAQTTSDSLSPQTAMS
jgi:predicted DsbA family dithiol-disulfide isomerase